MLLTPFARRFDGKVLERGFIYFFYRPKLDVAYAFRLILSISNSLSQQRHASASRSMCVH